VVVSACLTVEVLGKKVVEEAEILYQGEPEDILGNFGVPTSEGKEGRLSGRLVCKSVDRSISTVFLFDLEAFNVSSAWLSSFPVLFLGDLKSLPLGRGGKMRLAAKKGEFELQSECSIIGLLISLGSLTAFSLFLSICLWRRTFK